MGIQELTQTCCIGMHHPSVGGSEINSYKGETNLHTNAHVRDVIVHRWLCCICPLPELDFPTEQCSIPRHYRPMCNVCVCLHPTVLRVEMRKQGALAMPFTPVTPSCLFSCSTHRTCIDS